MTSATGSSTLPAAIGVTGFPGAGEKLRPEAGRYHLFVSYACPFSHLMLIARSLKRLETAISISVVEPYLDERGWRFGGQDAVSGASRLSEIYHASDPDYHGRITVPVLWDKRDRRIVSNESSEIFRMLDEAFAGIGLNTSSLRPPELVEEVDALSSFIRDRLNFGVYRVGFAADQTEYDEAVASFFDALDTLEARTTAGDWLVAGHLTEADIRLFVTLVRFDLVYHTHFKCNWRHAYEYPGLWSIARRLYADQRVSKDTHFEEILAHYYGSHKNLNPSGLIPRGPDIVDLLTA